MKIKKSERMFDIFNIVIMCLLCIVTLYPYLNQLAISLNQGADTAFGGITIFPRKFTMVNYSTVIANKSFISATVISVSKVLLGVFWALLVTTGAAYGVTRKNLPGRSFFSWFFAIPAYISAGVVPIYILFRYLHMINNFLVYILPAGFVFYNMVIIRSFLQELPASLEESAQIDGANEIQILFKVVIPLSMPVLATVALWVAVGQWNDWSTTLLYITDNELFPLQYLMMRLIKESEMAQEMVTTAIMMGSDTQFKPTSESIKAATLIVSTLPIILCYPFLQKYFVKGVVLGAVKG